MASFRIIFALLVALVWGGLVAAAPILGKEARDRLGGTAAEAAPSVDAGEPFFAPSPLLEVEGTPAHRGGSMPGLHDLGTLAGVPRALEIDEQAAARRQGESGADGLWPLAESVATLAMGGGRVVGASTFEAGGSVGDTGIGIAAGVPELATLLLLSLGLASLALRLRRTRTYHS